MPTTPATPTTTNIDIGNDEDLQKLFADETNVRLIKNAIDSVALNLALSSWATPKGVKYDLNANWKYFDLVLSDLSLKLNEVFRSDPAKGRFGYRFNLVQKDGKPVYELGPNGPVLAGGFSNKLTQDTSNQINVLLKLMKFYAAAGVAISQFKSLEDPASYMYSIQALSYGGLAAGALFKVNGENSANDKLGAASYLLLAASSFVLGGMGIDKVTKLEGTEHTIASLGVAGNFTSGTSQLFKGLEALAKVTHITKATSALAVTGIGLNVIAAGLSISQLVVAWANEKDKSPEVQAAYALTMAQLVVSGGLGVAAGAVAYATGTLLSTTGVGLAVAAVIAVAIAPLPIVQGVKIMESARDIYKFAGIEGPSNFDVFSDVWLDTQLNYLVGGLLGAILAPHDFGPNRFSQFSAKDGYAGDKTLGLLVQYLGASTVYYDGLLGILAGLNSIMKQNFLEKKADQARSHLLREYGTFEKLWDAGFQDRLERLFKDKGVIDDLVQMKAELQVQKLLVLSGIPADEYMQYLAAIIREGASLPSFGFKAFAIGADGKPVDQSSMVNFAAGTIDLTSLAKDQYVTSVSPWPSPTLETRTRQRGDGKNTYITTLEYVPRSWSITDGDTNTTFDARIMAQRNFNTRPTFDLKGGDDVVIAGAYGFVFDGGSGTDGVDYSAFAQDTPPRIGGITVTAGAAGSRSYTVDKGGVYAQWYSEVTKEKTFTYGKRTEVIQYTDVEKTIDSIPNGVQDTLRNVEWLRGSSGNDSFTGNSDDDTIIATIGNDTYNGQGGQDVVDYSALKDHSIRFDARTGLVTKTHSNSSTNTDTLRSLFVLRGTPNADTFKGDWQNDTLIGGGADTLLGNAGHDVLSFGSRSTARGGTGRDTLVFGDTTATGGNTLDGGRGRDSVNYSYLAGAVSITANLATGRVNYSTGGVDTLTGIEELTGTRNNDSLTGDDRANLLMGLAGNDTLIGAGGDDMLLGGDGDDSLLGGASNDWINTGSGKDTVYADSGDDTIVVGDVPLEPWATGQLNGKSIDGGSGSDTVDYSNQNQAIVPAGLWADLSMVNEQIVRSQNDKGFGSDYSIKTQANGAGTLAIVKAPPSGWGMGISTGRGGSNDYFLMVDGSTYSNQVFWRQDLLLKAGETYTLSFYANANSTVDVQAQLNGTDLRNGSVRVDTASGWNRKTITFTAQQDGVQVFGLRDLTTSGANDLALDDLSLQGPDGTELLRGGSFAGGLTQSTNDPVFVTDYWSQGAIGPQGTLTVRTTENIGFGEPTGLGGADDRFLSVNGSNNSNLVVWSQDVWLQARQTYKLSFMTGANSTVNLQVQLNGTDLSNGGVQVADTVDWHWGWLPKSIIFTAKQDGWQTLGLRDTNTEDNGNDFTLDGISLKGSDGVELVRGGDFNGFAIDDYNKLGGARHDSLKNIENLRGTAAADDVWANPQGSTLEGLGGNDTLRGGAGKDRLDGGAGDDSLLGGEGDDFLISGEGADTLNAGAGDDFMVLSHARTQVQNKRVDGGAGSDTVDYRSETLGGVAVDLSAATVTVRTRRQASGSFDAQSSTDTLIGIENVYGTDQADSLVGNAQDNTLAGFAGNDSLVGNDGNDTLYGGLGDDTLDGGKGNDTLYVGQGRDVVSPGAGNDVVIVEHTNRGIWRSTTTLTPTGLSFVDLAFTNLLPGDFNGDGLADLLRQEKGSWANDNGQMLNVQQGGTTAGSFSQVHASATNGNVPGITASEFNGNNYQLWVGDFNGDGRSDVLKRRTSTTRLDKDKALQVWLTQADGSLALGEVDENANAEGVLSDSVYADSDALWVADFNGDGLSDLLRRASGGWDNAAQGALQVFMGNGRGGFEVAAGDKQGNPIGLLIGDWRSDKARIYTGDFNGDGKADILRQEYSDWANDNAATLRVYHGDGQGGFTPAPADANSNSAGVTLSDVNGNNTLLVVGDFNGDGLSDFVAQSTGKVYLSDGRGGFVAQTTTLAAHAAPTTNEQAWQALDLNGDGRNELLARTATGTQIFQLNWEDIFQDALTIDGGSGTDGIDYKRTVSLAGGLDADLANAAAQTVKLGVINGSLVAGGLIDNLQNFENIGGTLQADRIRGSDDANAISAYSGDDTITAGLGADTIDAGTGNDIIWGEGGEDVINTGTGRDTVDGGAGDDTIVVGHARSTSAWSRSSYVGTSASSLSTIGCVADIDWNNAQTRFTLGGAGISGNPCASLSKVDTSVAGQASLWVQTYDSAANTTKAVKLQLSDQAAGGVSAQVLGAKSVSGDVTNSGFDWDSNAEATSQSVATSATGAGYGIKDLSLTVLAGWSDAKQIDGGAGTDTVDYSGVAVAAGQAGIWADLSTTTAQTVRNLRDERAAARQTYSATSGEVADSLQSIENLGATNGNDFIVGSAGDNRLWAYDGDDSISAGAGNDVINTGTGRDTVDGGAGDDTIVVGHARSTSVWSRASYLNTSASSLSSLGCVADIDWMNPQTRFTLGGKSITGSASSSLSKIDTSVAGQASLWVQTYDSAANITKAVKLQLADQSSGGVSIQVLGAKSTSGDVTGSGFDWDTSTTATNQKVATSDTGEGIDLVGTNSEVQAKGQPYFSTNYTVLQNTNSSGNYASGSLAVIRGAYGNVTSGVGSSNDAYLLVSPSSDGSQVFWSQQVYLKAGQTYTYSFYSTGYGMTYNLALQINGKDITQTGLAAYNATNFSDNWFKQTVDLTPTQSGYQVLALRVQNPSTYRFAIDSMSLKVKNGDQTELVLGGDFNGVEIRRYPESVTTSANDQSYGIKALNLSVQAGWSDAKQIDGGAGTDTVNYSGVAVAPGQAGIWADLSTTTAQTVRNLRDEGFGTDYTVRSQANGLATLAVVTAPPNGWAMGIASGRGGSNDSFLMVDGSSDSRQVFWRQDVLLKAGQSYTLSFYVNANSDVTLQAQLNGVDLSAGGVSVRSADRGWTLKTLTFTVTQDGWQTVGLRDRNTEAAYNDIAIDDISLKGPDNIELIRGGSFSAGTTTAVMDRLQNIENLGATNGNDFIVGSAGDNRLWAYDGDDSISAGAGNDVINTGTGRDTVDGGAGDDTVVVGHARSTSVWSRASYLNTSASSLSTMGCVANIDWSNAKTSFTLGGLSIGSTISAGKAVLLNTSVAGQVSLWVQAYELGYTKAVKLQLDDMAGGGVSVQVLKAAYINRDVTDDKFDWDNDTTATSQSVATSATGAGYGIKDLSLTVLAGWSDAKQIDGGAGTDTVNYSGVAVAPGQAGIWADLSTTTAQTVRNLRDEGFGTDYTVRSQANGLATLAVVTAPPNGWAMGIASGRGGSNAPFLMVDGSSDSRQVFWRQDVLLKAGQSYTLSFYVSANSNVALQAQLNGVDLSAGGVSVLSADRGWTLKTLTFTVTQDGWQTVGLRDRNTEAAYNDIAIDDISLKGPDNIELIRGGSFSAGTTTAVMDRLQNIENLGATNGNDFIVGSAGDNRLWAYDGDDSISAGAGNDVINTGTGRDTVDGGAGDDTIVVGHARSTSVWSRSSYLGTSAITLSNIGCVADIDWANAATRFTLGGAGITGNPSTGLSNKVDTSVSGQASTWVQTYDSAANTTKAVKLQLADQSSGGVNIQVLGAKSTSGDVTNSGFDWDSNAAATSQSVATSDTGTGYGIKALNLSALAAWSDAKQIDGGAGTDTVDYSGVAVAPGQAGIWADLSPPTAQTVRNLRDPRAKSGAVLPQADTFDTDYAVGTQAAGAATLGVVTTPPAGWDMGIASGRGGSNDAFLMVDGSRDNSQVFWRQDVLLKAGQNYALSFYVNANSNVQLQAQLNGVDLSTGNVSVLKSDRAWTLKTVHFTATQDGWQTVGLRDLNTESAYNDIALDDISLKGSDNVELVRGGSFSNVTGVNNGSATQANTAIGPEVADRLQSIENLRGTNGNDRLQGSAGSNMLLGLDGDDTIDGGAGDDTLLGGQGTNTLTGGAGQDKFLFNLLAGKSTITDFNKADDTIALAKSAFAALNNLTALSASNLVAKSAATGSGANTATQAFVVYDKDTGELAYDATGKGEWKDSNVFAVLSTKPTSLEPGNFAVL